MKKIDGIFDQICSIENLYHAAHNTLKNGRRYKGQGAHFIFNLERNIEKIRYLLTNRTYKPDDYNVFLVFDPKEREIISASFRDRVIHHGVHDIIEPLIDRKLIYDTYACRKGKGTHRAIERAQKFVRANRFALHMDIVKFFPSINRMKLKDILRHHIADCDVLWLLDSIIENIRIRKRRKDIQVSLFKADDLDRIMMFEEKRGIPIGNLTSQFFGNLYLDPLDQHIKHQLKEKYYLRYMDDMLLFGDSPAKLKSLLHNICQFVENELHVQIHKNTDVLNVKNGISFLGYRIYAEYKLLKSANIRRFFMHQTENYNQLIGHCISESDFKARLRSWNNFASFGDTWNLRTKIFPVVSRGLFQLSDFEYDKKRYISY